MTLNTIVRSAWEPISDQSAHVWVSEHINLSNDSELKNFEFELVPLAKFFFDQLCGNEHLRRYTEMVSSQTGKTVRAISYLIWKLKNRPSGTAWYTDTAANAKDFFKTRLMEQIEACDVIAPMLPKDRSKKGNTLIQFDSMNLRIMGAESKRNREGKTMSEVLCDEVRNYPAGAMQQIDNRYKTITNYRRVLFSVPGDMTQEPWVSFKEGTRHMGFWNCPRCAHKQTFRFGRKKSPLYDQERAKGGFVWEDNPTTHPEDLVYNFPELVKTIAYECEGCGHQFKETDKLALVRSVRFEQTNPMADPSDVSVHCWEAYMPFAGCSWAGIVMKFLKATVAMRQGNIEPLKVFIRETLGEPWEEFEGEKPEESELLDRCGEYAIGEEWPSEIECARLITVDFQHGFIVFVYRAYDRDGASRLIEAGKLLDFEELRFFQQAKKVKDRGVGIDCAYHPRDVFAACLKHGRWASDPTGGKNHVWNGWLPLLGDDATDFTETVSGVRVRQFFKATLLDTAVGIGGQPRYVQRYSWSNGHYREKLYLYAVKGRTLAWTLPKNISQVAGYLKQMQATERVAQADGSGQIIGYKWRERGRHDFGDCELMQSVLCDINGIPHRK